jgi:redox-sensitive bicupin YhaK (pirin superfamily)
MKLRKSTDRGFANHGWLESYHSFSFSGYYDSAHMSYSVLRVINEDLIAAGQGFATHPHRNMEIITYMLQGELQHKDSLGNESILKAGDVQCMSAGTGIEHSESNASTVNLLHLLQIWILPEHKLLAPVYSEKNFTIQQKQDRWCLIVSHDGREESLQIHQDVILYASVLSAGKYLDYALLTDRCMYLQVAMGEVEVFGQRLLAGDALMLDSASQFKVIAHENSEILLFDLPDHNKIKMFEQ